MLNDPRSHGLWEKTAPAAPVTPPLSGAVEADVVIVGGGYTGISAALHLAEAGTKVVLLEATEIGFGGAGRNVGLINGGMWVMPSEIPGVLGPVYGERVLDLLGNAPLLVRALVEKHDIACEIEKNGTLHCAVGEAGLQGNQGTLQPVGSAWRGCSHPVGRRNGEAHRHHCLCRLVARHARRHAPAAGLRSGARQGGNRRGRENPHRQRCGFDRA